LPHGCLEKAWAPQPRASAPAAGRSRTWKGYTGGDARRL